MSSKKNASLDLYYKRRDRCRITFPCPRCNQIMSSKQYASHCKSCLNLDPAIQCIWCQGKQSWRKFTKCKNVNHLLGCWKQFITPYSEPPNFQVSTSQVAFENFVIDDSEPMCPERSLFGRSIIPNLSTLAYKHIFLMDLDIPSLPFQDEGISKAVGCIQKFLKLHKKYEFFHCMVRAVAFPSFLRAMEADQGLSCTLPFSCWCDGGKEREPLHRQHRHMIIVSPEQGRFDREVWRKISIPRKDRPFKNFKCIRKKPIESAMHLVNTMGYLSKRESRCNGTFGKNRRVKENLNHFWILTPLPKNFRLPVVLQWDGGIMKLITQEYRNLKPEILAQAPLQKNNGQWQIAVKNLPGIQLYLVLLVSKEFKPTTRGPTNHLLHLNRGQKLYFEKDDSLKTLDAQTWGRIQAKMGNLFYSVVGDELWTPSPFQQTCLTVFENKMDEIDQLKGTLQKKDEEIEKEAFKEKDLVMAEQQEAFKQKCLEYEAKIVFLRKEMFEKERNLQETLKQKDEEIDRLKGLIGEKERLNQFLREEFLKANSKHESSKEEIQSSEERENGQLKKKIEKLVDEIIQLKKPRVCHQCQENVVKSLKRN